MILLDTHIWVWWISGKQVELLSNPGQRLAISVISCWEVAKLVQYGRLQLDRPVSQWLDTALAHPRLELMPLTPAIAVESTRLPEPFHRDPADQIIVATARVHGVPLLTEDSKILAYQHVGLVPTRTG